MEIYKQIKLGNGLEINYIIIYSIEILVNSFIKITLHGFYSKELYNKAIEKNNLKIYQDNLINEINKLQLSDNYDETEASIINTKINDLANQIDNLKDYNDYLVSSKTIEIPYINNYSEEYILEEINKRI